MQEIDFSALREQLGPLEVVSIGTTSIFLFHASSQNSDFVLFAVLQILLCIDVAATSARSTNMAKQLLDQALSNLSTNCWIRAHIIFFISLVSETLVLLTAYDETVDACD